MPVVPRLDGPRVNETGIPGARVSTDAPIEAFGGGASATGAFGAAKGLGKDVFDIIKEEKKKADELAVLNADDQLSKTETDLLYNPVTGAINKKGKDSFGLPEQVMKSYGKSVEDIDSSLSNDEQKLAFKKMAVTRQNDVNRKIQLHVSGEIRDYDNTVTNSYITSEQEAATANYGDSQRIGLALERQKAAISDHASRNGLPPEWVNEKTQAAVSKTHSDVVNRILADGNGLMAKQYYDANKDGIMGTDQSILQTRMDKELSLDRGSKAWDQLKGFKLSDGTPDEAKMESTIMARKDLSTKDKLEVVSFVKARASEDLANTHREQAANDRSFMNLTIQNKSSGADLQSALRLANQSGRDAYDQAVKADVVQKLYAPPTDSDPSTFMNTWERVQDGKASRDEIDKAMQSGKINVSDWKSLRETYYKNLLEGSNPVDKANWDRIKNLAEDSISNKSDKEKFLYEMRIVGQGKSPEETWKLANDKLKGTPGTGVFGFFQDKQWKTDVQKIDAQNLAWGKAHEDLGEEATKAIGKGVLYSGKKEWGLGDIDSFAAEFGGYQNIKAGTPVNNAIKALQSHDQLATPANIKAVLSKHPDGNY